MPDEIRKVNDAYSSAAQITSEQLTQAAADGFKSVLNLRAADEPGFIDTEDEQAAALGLAYRNTPVSPSQAESAPLQQALEALGSLPQPVLIHCRGGLRATAVALAAIALDQNLSHEQFVERVQAEGLTLDQPQIQQFIQDHYS